MGCCLSCKQKRNTTVDVEPGRDGYQSLLSHKTRNIILFGKTGAGKATVANEIFGSPEFKVSTSVEGITRSAGDSTARKIIHSGISDITYTIKLVDTVEESSTELDARRISAEMKSFAKSTRGGIHLVLFVFKYGRFTKEDKDAFDFIIKKFQQDIPSISVLVITRCEGLDVPSREQCVTEFQTDKATTSIARSMEKGILTVGFPKLSDVKEDLRRIYEESMKTDAEALKDLVAKASTGICLRQ